MDRRRFLFSVSGLAVAPGAGSLAGGGAEGGGDPLFDAWLQGFIDRAAGAGWSRASLTAVFADVTSDARVIKADRAQPELSKPIGDYISAAVSERRVDQGMRLHAADAAWLDPIAASYGVPPQILIAIWGMESSYGQIQGGYDVIRSLATLAAEGRRKDWAESQLFSALRILITAQAQRGQLKGSWAGAMGQTQFTPSDYLAWAVDGDGDGRRDIWGSAPDALASAANFMANKAAWRTGERWAREVILPEPFDYGLAEGVKQPWAAWARLGVRTADGLPIRPAEASEAAGLILPAGWTGPAFLAFPNHYAIRAYNNSMAYALAVGLIADRIDGVGPLLKPWPQEQPIPLADRIAAQEALARLGYDPGTPDGVLGLKTRQAARQWQKSRAIPADGYLTYGLIQRLKADAAKLPPTTLTPTTLTPATVAPSA
jgi:lytic murein transglycosylase